MVGEAEATAIVEAVRRVARAEILPRFRVLGSADVRAKGAPDDLVTGADHASEEALAGKLSEILPAARIVGEEAVSENRSLLAGIGEAGATFIVDPIDGTWNYANGIAVFGVIISVVEDGETTFGLLYDPIGDDWIAARKGDGAWFGGAGRSAAKVRASAGTGALEDTFGFVGMYLYPKAEQALIAATLPRFRRTQSLRCSCHEYRMLATGRAAFALNGMLNPWDHAAGVLCLREAGGVARLLDGTEYVPSMTEGRLLTAASETLWDEHAGLYSTLSC